ncbi:MAG: tRNA (adenosine(37)-N6)-dimethylallyltransferase MiaA [candidate division WOR-3 bacterium]
MRIFVLTGPTGVGKSEVAVALAERFGLEIISADSRQIYRHFDIGTDKPSRQLRQQIPFHLIDILEPDQPYSAAEFARDARSVIEKITKARGKFIIVGGSVFYLRALFQPLFPVPRVDPAIRQKLQAEDTNRLYLRLKEVDPERANQLHPHDRQRIVRALEVYELTGKTFTQLSSEQKETTDLLPVYAVLTMPRERLYQRINERFDRMMANGLLEEVRSLKEMGFGTNTPAVQGYGYLELFLYLEGKIGLDEAVRLAKKRTRGYAKRQLTWLHSLKGAHWFEFTDIADVVSKIEPLLLDTLNIQG